MDAGRHIWAKGVSFLDVFGVTLGDTGPQEEQLAWCCRKPGQPYSSEISFH